MMFSERNSVSYRAYRSSFQKRRQQGIYFVLIVLLILHPSLPLLAQNPTGGTFAAGSGSISSSGSTLNVQTRTDRAVINWQGFNIGRGNTTQFHQPGSQSAVLNRVTTPNSPSAIHGSLRSNGNVYLVNPSGVVVGPSGQINTNGFTASALDIPNQEFMKGGDLHFRGNSRASVINQGTITTGSGGATLIGGQVINDGVIRSHGGSINMVTGGSVRLSSGGTYTQADQGTIRNGISETSGLIRNSGTLRATGALEQGGEVYLVSPGGKVMQQGRISAQRIVSPAGTSSYASSSPTERIISRRVISSSDSTTGGNVVVTGQEVVVSGNIDASGTSGGGTVNIGGGFQGSDPGILNAQSTTVTAESNIAADALENGKGGTVVLWSDGSTDFTGTITASGSLASGNDLPLGSGGLVEVSGKESLNFAGSVNTGGGHLLLDPFNYTIGLGQATNIVNALTSNNVTIMTSVSNGAYGGVGPNTAPGDITVNAPIVYDSANDLTFLAHRHIRFNQSVQNRNGAGGDINIVAGWDGTTPFDFTTFANVDVNAASPTLFGNSTGTVFIGNGSQPYGVAVGSRSGATNVFAHDVILTANRTTRQRAFAQLGFRVSDGLGWDGYRDMWVTIPTVNGPITIHAVNDLSATAGGGWYNYAQVGHVGADFQRDTRPEAAASSDIELSVGNNISFMGGYSRYAYAQLGQGGYYAYGNHSGTTTITTANDISFVGGRGGHAYAQLGQGGIGAFGNNHTGTTTITTANNISFKGGGGDGAYAQLGQGGYGAFGNHTGTTTITTANDISFTGGGNYYAYAQLGQGGINAYGSHSGTTTITTANNISFTGGGNRHAYAQLGQGGSSIADGNHSGTTTITTANDISFTAGDFEGAYAQLGQGGYNADGNHSGSTTITTANNIAFTGGGGRRAYAQLGQGGIGAGGSHTGTTTITTANNISFSGGTGGAAYAQLGQGGLGAEGSHSGSTTITTANDISFSGGSGHGSNAQLGQGGQTAFGNHSGTTMITTANDISFSGGDGDRAYAQLGQGGVVADGNHSGSTTITTANDISFMGGGYQSYAQLGQGGAYTDGDHTGTTTIDAGNNISFMGGSGVYAYAQLGHGGAGANGSHSGTTTIDAGNDITFSGGSNQYGYAQLGQGGVFANGDQSGTTTITTANNISFSGGLGVRAYAQLGQGGADADGDHSGTNTITTANDISFSGGSDLYAYAQLGQGGALTDGKHSGTTTITTANDISFSGGSGHRAYAHLGQGGYGGRGNYSGTTTITTANDISFMGGSGSTTYAQLGQGGAFASGNHSGTTMIDAANDIAFSGDNDLAYAQLGQGGVFADGNHSGDIDVTHRGNLTLTGMDSSTRYAIIGHGDEPGDGDDAGNQVNGNITIRTGESISLTNAFIGHIIDSDGSYNGGKTHIAIGQNDYSANNTTATLTTDTNSRFFSAAAADGGELRFYLPTHDSWNANGSARLNGTPSFVATDFEPFVNEVGEFDPFAGGYLGNTNHNYSFYFASTVIDIIVNALSGSSTYGDTPADPGMDLVSGTLRSGDTLGSIGLTTNFNLDQYSNAGTYTLTVDDTNLDDGYNLAGTTGGTFTIHRAALTITANDLTKTYGVDHTFVGTEFTTSPTKNFDFVEMVTLSSVGADPTASVAGGPYDIVVSNAAPGLGFNPNNYDITYVPGKLTVDPAPLTITANDLHKTYGVDHTFIGNEFVVSMTQNNEVVEHVDLQSIGTAPTASVAGGPYAITGSNAEGSNGFDASNYAIEYAIGNLTVERAGLDITANSLSKTYGVEHTFTGTEFTASETQNNEVVDLVDLSSTGTPASASVDGNPYRIRVSNATGSNGFDPNNYEINYHEGELTVTPADLVITPTAQSKTYGDPAFSLDPTAFTISGLQNDDTVSEVALNSLGEPTTANVGAYDIVSTAITQSNSFDANNYNITFQTLEDGLTINPADLVITADDQSKTYGDAFTFAGTEFSSVGLQNGETIGSVTLASSGAPATADVNTYAITASNPTGGTFDANNYNISFTDGTFTVNPADLVITADDQSKTYGDAFTFAGTEFSSVGLQNGETIGSVTLASDGAPATADVNTYAITASNPTGGTFDANNYNISFTDGTFTVNPADLVITADDQSKTYGDAFTFAGTEFSSVGLQNGETIGSVTLASSGAPATADVNTYAITASNPTGGTFDANNYNISFTDGIFTVNPADLVITADDQSKTYGDAFTFAGTEFSSVGLQNGETIGSVTLASSGAPATADVNTYAITASNPTGGTFDANNYNISFTDGTFTVNPADLVITADDQSKTYGDAFTFAGTEFSSVGLQNGETIGSVTLASSGAPATADVNTYAITASNPTGGTFDANNYNISFTDGTFTVNPADLVITADDQSKTYGDAFTFAGTEFSSVGLQNGETIGSVTLASSGAPATADVNTYAITASNPTGGTFDANNYNISFTDGTFTVNPADLVITADDQSKTYGDAFTFAGTEFSSVGLQNSETIGSVTLASSGAPATADVNTYAITASNPTGGTFDANNYNISFTDGTFTVNPADLVITPTAQSKTYGDPAFPLDPTAFTISGLKNDDTVSEVALSSLGEPTAADVGTYDIVSTAITQSSSFDANNYNITLNTLDGGLTVNPADLFIVAIDQNKPFGATAILDPTAFLATGLQNGDTIDTVALSSAGTPADAPLGAYAIDVNNPMGATFNPNNYNVTLSSEGNLFVSGIGSPLYSYDETRRYSDYADTIYRLFMYDLSSAAPPLQPTLQQTIDEESDGESDEDEVILPQLRISSSTGT